MLQRDVKLKDMSTKVKVIGQGLKVKRVRWSICLQSTQMWFALLEFFQMDRWIQIKKNKTKIAKIGMLIQFWKLLLSSSRIT